MWGFVRWKELLRCDVTIREQKNSTAMPRGEWGGGFGPKIPSLEPVSAYSNPNGRHISANTICKKPLTNWRHELQGLNYKDLAPNAERLFLRRPHNFFLFIPYSSPSILLSLSLLYFYLYVPLNQVTFPSEVILYFTEPVIQGSVIARVVPIYSK
jgi:hypothetical protein